MAATYAAHQRTDSGISVQDLILHQRAPSPTLINPELLLPRQAWPQEASRLSLTPSENSQLGLELMRHESNISTSTDQRDSGGPAEFGVATAIFMPQRLSVPIPTTISTPATPPARSPYNSYEHGAPLSDIVEESDRGEPTPHARMDRRSRSPHQDGASSPTPLGLSLRPPRRMSAVSTSSAGSDVDDWEDFDSSKMLTDRVAADIARMRRDEASETEDLTSRRSSQAEEELAQLNERAEKILANARKRLTHMEDNLKVARHSVLMPSRSSPHLGPDIQPAGSLYRSISAVGASKLAKSRPVFPSVKNGPQMHHVRGASDTGVPSGLKRLSRVPEVRSASAMEYGMPTRLRASPDSSSTPSSRLQISPASTLSYSSPLRPLEEEGESPSTTETTPESARFRPPQGLGIHHVASASKTDLSLTLVERPLTSVRHPPVPTNIIRSASSASTGSTRELKEQMSDLKSRIAELKSRAQADHFRRRSIQSLRTPSPFSNHAPEDWYTDSPAYQQADGNPVNSSAGKGWLLKSEEQSTQPDLHDTKCDIQSSPALPPVTPSKAKYIDVENLTPAGESELLASTRTDRNTPSLARAREVTDGASSEGADADVESMMPSSQYKRPKDVGRGAEDEREVDEGEGEGIFANEEEQIYLNEVLEESLRDAEVEPEVPVVPREYLPEGEDGASPTRSGSEAERHEDRLDAFDYENMFLHSAMGNYTGKSLSGSVSGSDSDNESVETSRADVRTPTNAVEEEEDAYSPTDPVTDDEADGRLGYAVKSSPRANAKMVLNTELRSPPPVRLPHPPKPWLKNARSNSVDSCSTSASFRTATEGEYGSVVDEDEEDLDEILNWGRVPVAQANQSSHTYQTNQGITPRKVTPIAAASFPTPPGGGGRSTPSTTSPSSRQVMRSPISFPRLNGHQRVVSDDLGSSPFKEPPGLGIGVVGAENAQYINDNGVPERFQGKPSPTHSRQNSKNSPVPHPSPTTLRDLSQVKKFFSPAQFSSPGPRNFPVISSPNLMHEPKQQPPYEQKEQQQQQQQPAQRPPNTEILMESLIKLADPNFALQTNTRFADVDKELVLGLLRAVGGVCNGVLRAEKSGNVDMADTFRTRFRRATELLEGRR